MAEFSFEILRQDTKTRARAGIIKTRRGEIRTPCFVPVATSGSVPGLDSKDLETIGADCVFANTYHLMLRPGHEVIKEIGGIHKHINYEKPILTDSGGFQAFSLGLGKEHNINKIGKIFPDGRIAEGKQEKYAFVSDSGFKFKSIYDGSEHFLSAKKSMKIQSALGSDIIMAFDECTSPLSDYEYTKEAMERTHKWALECLKYRDSKQAIYGIIQGGWFEDLRMNSTEFINKMEFDGIAIGGSLGKSKKDMHQILDWVVPKLDERPRHLLGIGGIDDIFECVERGIDSFDCVYSANLARHGNLYIHPDRNKCLLDIRKSKYVSDLNPIDDNCGCYTCGNFSRAYMHHLYKGLNEKHGKHGLTFYRLATIHNLSFVLRLMDDIRESIKGGRFYDLKRRWVVS